MKTYTEEQEKIFDLILTSTDNLAVIAYAGSGKTTTMIEAVRLYVQKNPKAHIALIYFNKAAREDAQARIAALGLDANVSVWTNHTIPFVTIGQGYANNHRLLGIEDSMCKRWSSADIATYFGVDDFSLNRDGNSYLVKGEQIAQFAQRSVNAFVTSDSWKLTEYHVPRIPAVEEIMDVLKPVIADVASKIWRDKRSPKNGKLSITHDDYLKMFSMTTGEDTKWYPRKTMLISDEYQDTNPAQFSILRRHSGMRQVGVGDPFQAIYGFRQAQDYLKKFNEIKRKGESVPHQIRYLTKTWRFGGEVVEEANKWLTLADADMPLIGNDSVASKLVDSMTDPDLYLTRTNSGAILAALDMIKNGRTYSIHGGADTIRNFAEGAAKLMAGEPSAHPELLGFRDWEQFVKFTEDDPSGADLRTVQRIISKHGIEDVLRLADNALAEGEAETHIATAHTQKGREAKKVKIGDDFAPQLDKEGNLKPPALPEIFLAYVAVTRAEEELDRGPLEAVDDYLTMADDAA